MLQKIKTKIIALTLLTIVGCAAQKEGQLSRDAHIVRINNDGMITFPDIAEKDLKTKLLSRAITRRQAETNIKNIFDQAELLGCEKNRAKFQPNNSHEDCVAIATAAKKAGKKIPVKILIFVHGGLNKYRYTDTRLKKIAPLIRQGQSNCEGIVENGDDWHYPVFVSWPSNAAGTWYESTFRIREGRKASFAAGLASAPFIFAADAAQSIAKYPVTLMYQLANEKDTIATDVSKKLLSSPWARADQKFCGFACEWPESGNYNNFNECGGFASNETTARSISSLAPSEKVDVNCKRHQRPARLGNLIAVRSGYHRLVLDSVARTSGHIITAPIRFSVGTAWHSTISEASWRNMKRRTSNIFYPTYLFGDKTVPKGEGNNVDGHSGGYFFRELLSRANGILVDGNLQPTGFDYQISLVGHSMGTIVINKFLSNYHQQIQDSGAVKNIVYMAAAASIEDSLEAIAPIVTCTRNRFCKNTPNFYNLMLNRVAEVSETHLGGVVPTGSLLISIDQHLDNPQHPLQRTMGAEINVFAAFDVIWEKLKLSNSKVHFKSFDRHPHTLPNKHGDFGLFPFWLEETWNATTSTESRLPTYVTENDEFFNAYPNPDKLCGK